MSRARQADWMTVEDALATMLQAVAPLGSERVQLLEAAGRVLASPAISPIELPPWDNSAMDGYAAHAADLAGASEASPVRLQLAGEVAAGGLATAVLARGTVLKIMTGAPVPAGADSVVRVEHTRTLAGGVVEVLDASDSGRNIRPRGEDMHAGETVVREGTLLRPQEIGVLASMGSARVAVYRRPRVAVVATGDELVDVADFAEVSAGRRIVNSNSYALHAALHATGCVPLLLGIARDQESDLRQHLERALSADALITTAGASVGEHDLVKDVLEGLGLELRFWRVRMRPGSPFSFGTMARPGRASLPVFGLPGNPVSAVVTFEVLVRPVLRRMLGRSDVYPLMLRVRTAEPIPSRRGLKHFLRATLERDAAGEWRARLTGAQGSGMLTSLVRANALLVVPETRDSLAEGELATALPLPGLDGAQAAGGFGNTEAGNA